jgi:GNAT superfamily N-acetyltransferase
MIYGPDGRMAMTTTVQVAGEADVATLAELRDGWTTETLDRVDDTSFATRFADWMAAQEASRTFWIARDGGRPVGMVNMLVVERMPRSRRPDSRWGYLGNLFVVADHRRAGVGSLLVEAVLTDAAARGLERILVHPNERSQPFWQRSAFEQASDLLVYQLS